MISDPAGGLEAGCSIYLIYSKDRRHDSLAYLEKEAR